MILSDGEDELDSAIVFKFNFWQSILIFLLFLFHMHYWYHKKKKVYFFLERI